MKAKLPPVLLADDNEDDIFLIRQAWHSARLPNSLVVTMDGYQAIDYLGAQPPFTDRAKHPLPCLLLLDISMRFLDGFEVLTWLRTRPDLQHIPAVILSGSSDEKDRLRARDLGASDYCVKPLGFEELQLVLAQIHARWAAPRRTRAARSRVPAEWLEPAIAA